MAVFEVTRPRYAHDAQYQVLSGEEMQSMEIRSVEIRASERDPGKETMRRVEPLGEKGAFMLKITD